MGALPFKFTGNSVFVEKFFLCENTVGEIVDKHFGKCYTEKDAKLPAFPGGRLYISKIF